MIDIFYHRPKKASLSTIDTDGSFDKSIDDKDERSIAETIRPSTSTSLSSSTRRKVYGVPDKLSYELVMAEATCSPCSMQDFTEYLIHVEHTVENLLFCQWHDKYIKIFADLSEFEKAKSPEWTGAASARLPKTKPIKRVAGADKYPEVNIKEFLSELDKDKPPGFMIQGFRREVEEIRSLYISRGAPREINLSSADRNRLNIALDNTTHPSAFNLLRKQAEYSLRHYSHPNFIRFAIGNGTKERITVAMMNGIITMFLSVIAGVLLTLSSAGRCYRIIPAFGFMLGVSTIVLAARGMCIMLHMVGRRNKRPWELTLDNEDEESGRRSPSEAGSYDNARADDKVEFARRQSIAISTREGGIWQLYRRKRNWLARSLEKEDSIHDPALRQIQKTMGIQGFLFGLLGLGCYLALFLSLPSRHIF